MKKEFFRIERGIKNTGIADRVLDFSVQIYQGEICGLYVENNSECRLLDSLLSGEEKLDYGWIYFEEKEISLDEYRQIAHEKIQLISREERLSVNQTVKENVFLMHKGIPWLSRRKKICAPATTLFQELDCEIDPEENLLNLNSIQKKVVELIHAYVAGKKLIIFTEMDEYFTEETMPYFLKIIRKLQKLGMNFLVKSNNTKVLFQYTDYLYIFLRGRTTHRMMKEHYSVDLLYSVILAKNKAIEDEEIFLDKDTEVLRFEEIQTQYGGNVHFAVKKGEVVNFVSEELESWRLPADILTGEEVIKKGKIFIGGKPFSPHSFHDAMKYEIGVIEVNSQRIANYCGKTVLDNIMVVLAGKVGLRGFSKKYVKSMIKELIDLNEFSEEELYQHIYEASAETIQKMAYFRWILFQPKLMVCIRPFSSADYAMQNLTCHLIRYAQKRGISVLILTMSISEASIIGDRIIVSKEGKLYEQTRNNIETFV